MPEIIRNELLQFESSDSELLDRIVFDEFSIASDKLSQADEAIGLTALLSLQDLKIEDHLTLFRSIRFPTPKRLKDMLTKQGPSLCNFEQRRLLELYKSDNFINAKDRFMQETGLSFLPQERIVNGMPVFFSANDAVQIHSGYRRLETDYMVLAVLFVPHNLIKNNLASICCNPPFVKDYDDESDDFVVDQFKESESGHYLPDYSLYQASGQEIYECYAQGLPKYIADYSNSKIKVSYFMLKLIRLNDTVESLIENCGYDRKSFVKDFPDLYGIFGNYSVFQRKPMKYLPSGIWRLDIDV